jgi:hypothetical protein
VRVGALSRRRSRLLHAGARHRLQTRRPRQVGGQALRDAGADPAVPGVGRAQVEVEDGQGVRHGGDGEAAPGITEITLEASGIPVAIAGIAGERLLEDGVQAGCDGRDGVWIVGAARRRCGPPPWPRETPVSPEHLVEHRPQREEIGARVHRSAGELLRRHVSEGAHDRPASVSAVCVWESASSGRRCRARPKSRSLAVCSPTTRTFSGLRFAVGGHRRRARVRALREGRRRSPSPSPRAARPGPGACAGSPRHIFHGDEGDPLVLAGLEEGGDGGVLEPARGLGLAEEAAAQLGSEALGEELQGGGLPSARSSASHTPPCRPRPGASRSGNGKAAADHARLEPLRLAWPRSWPRCP